MKSVTVSQFKANCFRLIEELETTGETIQVTKNGRVCALVSPPQGEPRARAASSSTERSDTAEAKSQRGFNLGAAVGLGEIRGDLMHPASDESDWELD